MPETTQPNYSPSIDNSGQPNDLPHEYWASLMYDQSLRTAAANEVGVGSWRLRARPGLYCRRSIAS